MFLKLTATDIDSRTMYVNMNCVHVMVWMPSERQTWIWSDGQQTIAEVKETPEEIFDQLSGDSLRIDLTRLIEDWWKGPALPDALTETLLERIRR